MSHKIALECAGRFGKLKAAAEVIDSIDQADARIRNLRANKRAELVAEAVGHINFLEENMAHCPPGVREYLTNIKAQRLLE